MCSISGNVLLTEPTVIPVRKPLTNGSIKSRSMRGTPLDIKNSPRLLTAPVPSIISLNSMTPRTNSITSKANPYLRALMILENLYL